MSKTAFAANAAEIYAEPVKATTDKTILIPVKIKNNTGIMGFKITVGYDKSVLTSPKVIKGDITENGMMNDSIGVTQDGSIDIVWSGTQNEVRDGTLLILNFATVKAEDTQIKLSYSQPDTFNEAWEDVELKCSNISVEFFSDEVESLTGQIQSSETEKDYVTSSKTENKPSREKIKNVVDIVLEESGKETFESIPENEKSDFVNRTNEIFAQLTGKTEKPFESVDEIKDAYNEAVAEEFVDDAKEAVDSDKIETAINDSLASVGAESIEQIPVGRKEEFVHKVENHIAYYAPDVDTVSDKLTVDEAVEVIQQLQSKNIEAATEGDKLPEPQTKNNTAMLIMIIVTVFVSIAVITVAVVYIKHKKNKEAK